MASVESNGQIVKRLHMQLLVYYQKLFYLSCINTVLLMSISHCLLSLLRALEGPRNFSLLIFLHLFLIPFCNFFTFDRSRVLVNATFFFSPNFQYRTLSGSTGVSNFCQQQYCVLFHPYLTDLLWVSCKRVDGSCSKQLCQPEHTSYLSRTPRIYSCNFFLAGVNFYRFNAKHWHFRQILREKLAFFLRI